MWAYYPRMENSLHERVIARLQATRGRWQDIAKASKVSYRTIRKIASRDIKNPGVDKIEKLNSYFETHGNDLQ